MPTAMGCTTLALVDVAQTNPASLRDAARTLLTENQDCGEEMRDCSVRAASLRVGTYSAASPAQIEKSSTLAMPAAGVAIADQKIEPSRPSAELMAENSVSCDEVKAVHEGDCSTTVIPSAEKWSHEAIVARSNLRPERMQKLKVAANSGQNPGFDFL
ncbi:hypothetical protein LC609_35660 [Nostoc sp. XA013]|nr:hypothetical protein [Nostoc sp. XA013]